MSYRIFGLTRKANGFRGLGFLSVSSYSLEDLGCMALQLAAPRELLALLLAVGYCHFKAFSGAHAGRQV